VSCKEEEGSIKDELGSLASRDVQCFEVVRRMFGSDSPGPKDTICFPDSSNIPRSIDVDIQQKIKLALSKWFVDSISVPLKFDSLDDDESF
jgi:hypothetical protein